MPKPLVLLLWGKEAQGEAAQGARLHHPDLSRFRAAEQPAWTSAQHFQQPQGPDSYLYFLGKENQVRRG